MTQNRYQHLVPAGVIFALAAIVTWLSFTQEPADSFLFPRAISVFFIGLAAWNLIRAATGLAKVGGGMSAAMVMNILPGMVIMLIFCIFRSKSIRVLFGLHFELFCHLFPLRPRALFQHQRLD